MTASDSPEINDLPDGLTLSGKFLSTKVQHGKAIPDGDGYYPDKFIVTVLAGDRTVQVEYRDEAAAQAAGAIAPAPMEPVVIPVGVRAAKGYVFYFGRMA